MILFKQSFIFKKYLNNHYQILQYKLINLLIKLQIKLRAFVKNNLPNRIVHNLHKLEIFKYKVNIKSSKDKRILLVSKSHNKLLQKSIKQIKLDIQSMISRQLELINFYRSNGKIKKNLMNNKQQLSKQYKKAQSYVKVSITNLKKQFQYHNKLNKNNKRNNKMMRINKMIRKMIKKKNKIRNNKNIIKQFCNVYNNQQKRVKEKIEIEFIYIYESFILVLIYELFVIQFFLIYCLLDQAYFSLIIFDLIDFWLAHQIPYNFQLIFVILNLIFHILRYQSSIYQFMCLRLDYLTLNQNDLSLNFIFLILINLIHFLYFFINFYYYLISLSKVLSLDTSSLFLFISFYTFIFILLYSFYNLEHYCSSNLVLFFSSQDFIFRSYKFFQLFRLLNSLTFNY